ncbi:hypothetical protein Q0601_23000 [Paracoccus onubensis]|uniref:hypothetical protein n=1 Tax=Paracoccus onubensis TaxID=1675788 RepID=UPI002732046B|nr:hypothetical protein [Paracoccus onubensis]MDP0930056.1 hypothetical protein [Paracoccus onubensis]
MAVTLGRRAFLREIVIAGLLSLSLPTVFLAGIYVYLHTRGAALIGIAFGVIIISALTAIPLILYASLRFNAAALARERAVLGTSEQRIYQPLKGRFWQLRPMVAVSVRSYVLASFPACIGFGLEFALMSYVTTDSVFMPLHIPIGIMVITQTIIAANLLR